MKKMFSIVALAATLAISCKSNTDTANTKPAIPVAPDTAGLAQFQQWKAQNELSNTSQYNAAAPAPAAPATKTIVKYVPVQSGSTVYRSESSNAAKASSTKRGWSKGAKGAVIGGVGGAAAGAIINKRNRGAGAIIGGVLGAGAGYGIGHGKDKKDGRN
jgi:Glycine zipper